MQGNTNVVPLTNLDGNHWIKQHATEPRERHTHVYLLVYPPRGNDTTRHDLHWCLAWEVSDGNWKYIHLNVEEDNTDRNHDATARPGGQPPYCPSCGARTMDAYGTIHEGPRRHSIGRISLPMRNRIEEIARSVPIYPLGGLWTCQHWILAVLRRTADDGIISSRMLDDITSFAYNGMSPTLLSEGRSTRTDVSHLTAWNDVLLQGHVLDDDCESNNWS